jgi:hypothetical protein
VTDPSWERVTFEGAEDAVLDAVRTATPGQRWTWLMAALQLASRSGALRLRREQEQEELLAGWISPSTEES